MTATLTWLNQIMLMRVVKVIRLMAGEFTIAIALEPSCVDEWLICRLCLTYQDTMQPKLTALSFHDIIDAICPAPFQASMCGFVKAIPGEKT